MIYFICKSGYVSALRISQQMTIPTMVLSKKGDVWRYHRNRIIGTPIFERIRTLPQFNESDVIIMWGNHINLGEVNCPIINKYEASKLAADKRLSRLFLQEKGISVPKSFDNSYRGELKFPIIARPSKHHGGSDFHMINNLHDLLTNHNPDFYYQEVINKTNEYRVHVAFGKVIGINEKPIGDDIRANQAVTGLSWGTVLKWNDYPVELCRVACSAVKELGLDYGAVDVMYDGTTYYVAEVNTSPYIDEGSMYTAGRYAKVFEMKIKSGNYEHNDFSQYTKGKSFSWKNSQLGVSDESQVETM